MGTVSATDSVDVAVNFGIPPEPGIDDLLPIVYARACESFKTVTLSTISLQFEALMNLITVFLCLAPP